MAFPELPEWVKTIPDALRFHAQQTPNKSAIIWYGYELTYLELDRLSDQCAKLLKMHGVQKGEPVALFMQNCPQYVIAYLAIQKAGAIVSPCSPLFKPLELAYQLSDLGTRMVIAADNLYAILKEVLPQTQVEKTFLINYGDFIPQQPSYAVPEDARFSREMPSECIDLLTAMKLSLSDVLKTHLDPSDLGLLVYTSGTTGKPKGAMLTLGNSFFKSLGTAQYGEMDTQDIFLAIPPMYHISGMLFGINIPILMGSTAVLHFRYDAISAAQSIHNHRVSYWKGVAPMLAGIIQLGGAVPYDFSSLRMTTASSFGIPMSQELADQWLALTGCPSSETGYGLSETNTMDAMMPPREIQFGTNGKLLPGVSCRIVDIKSGKDLPVGSEGEIVLKSPANFAGYWHEPEKTAETLKDGWLYTGDIGKINADGYLVMLGRIKELIKVSGYSVYPADVESILLTHPKVDQVAVLGVPDASKGEVVKAVFVLKPEFAANTKPEELIAWSRENMSAYKVPRLVEFRDGLPKNNTGKVMRRMLQ
jgi:long-chain acyl-CoA synthetase